MDSNSFHCVVSVNVDEDAKLLAQVINFLECRLGRKAVGDETIVIDSKEVVLKFEDVGRPLPTTFDDHFKAYDSKSSKFTDIRVTLAETMRDTGSAAVGRPAESVGDAQASGGVGGATSAICAPRLVKDVDSSEDRSQCPISDAELERLLEQLTAGTTERSVAAADKTEPERHTESAYSSLFGEAPAPLRRPLRGTMTFGESSTGAPPMPLVQEQSSASGAASSPTPASGGCVSALSVHLSFLPGVDGDECLYHGCENDFFAVGIPKSVSWTQFRAEIQKIGPIAQGKQSFVFGSLPDKPFARAYFRFAEWRSTQELLRRKANFSLCGCPPEQITIRRTDGAKKCILERTKQYDQDRPFLAGPENELFITGIPKELSAAEVYAEFQKLGEILPDGFDLCIMHKADSPNILFVQFAKEEAVRYLLQGRSFPFCGGRISVALSDEAQIARQVANWQDVIRGKHS